MKAITIFATLSVPSLGDRNEEGFYDTPEWLNFIWAVNEVRPKTFDRPEITGDGDLCMEQYHSARVVHQLRQKTVLVQALTPAAAEAFQRVARDAGYDLL